MARGKVTKELLEQMTEARKSGATYKEIQERFGVGQWVTIHYLRGVTPEDNLGSEIREEARKKAIKLLKERGFVDVLNLKEICTATSFDFAAKKGNAWWLIDIKISELKTISLKAVQLIGNYQHAVIVFNPDLKSNRWIELR